MFWVMERYKNGKKIPSLVSLRDKKEHAAYKRPVATAYSMASLIKFEPYLDDMIRQLVDHLNTRFISPDRDGPRDCDIDKWLSYRTWSLS